MQRAPISPERISVALGLCIVMLATLPRYLAGGHETRQTLIIFALVVVSLATVVQWRLLAVEARRRLPRLCKRLVMMLLLGMIVMGAGMCYLRSGLAGRCCSPMAPRLGCCCMR
ncbi:hypothetical protein HORIV_33540 [Vreelandella olivaria]|uniref:Uncharacterized protein n=1 Tax=Vreelandella olivaria TaxID=390919 RepID=A0ABN5WVH8_9GAMM|nr:hypothetical protein HORIV_33540 [Halomonas olivaria]